MSTYREVNFDGLVGPTHNYAGLSVGNLASMKHRDWVSHPRAAALQGLAKMRMLHELGYAQALIPPQERPHMRALHDFGFTGSPAKVIEAAWGEAPFIAAACSSSSSMWTANAATVVPSCDSLDGRCHFTVANLDSKLHRAIEAGESSRLLRAIFRDEALFAHHGPIAGGAAMSDEGAANHTRLCKNHDQQGLHIFVYGRSGQNRTQPAPGRFVARQTIEASQAVARLNQLRPQRVLFLQQNPAAIDAGAFHNDVVAVGNRDFLFIHEHALLDQEAALKRLHQWARDSAGLSLRIAETPASRISLKRAIQTYLFNSQLLDFEDQQLLLAPAECAEDSIVQEYLEELVADSGGALAKVLYCNVRESMQNGGGPACLRLRVVLNEEELAKLGGRVLVEDSLLADLEAWVARHYRETLHPSELRDQSLYEESCRALDELTRILRIGNVYSFQRQAELA